MLSLGYPKINFQHKTEGAEDRLLQAIKSKLPEDEEEVEVTETARTNTNNKGQAFQVSYT